MLAEGEYNLRLRLIITKLKAEIEEEEESEEEEEKECCGKHCCETKGLKIGKGWNRYHLNIEEMITEQLWCEYCYEKNTTQKCKGCWEVSPYTDMEYKEGGNFGEAVCCYDQYYCKPCIVSINKIPYIEGEWD